MTLIVIHLAPRKAANLPDPPAPDAARAFDTLTHFDRHADLDVAMQRRIWRAAGDQIRASRKASSRPTCTMPAEGDAA